MYARGCGCYECFISVHKPGAKSKKKALYRMAPVISLNSYYLAPFLLLSSIEGSFVVLKSAKHIPFSEILLIFSSFLETR